MSKSFTAASPALEHHRGVVNKNEMNSTLSRSTSLWPLKLCDGSTERTTGMKRRRWMPRRT